MVDGLDYLFGLGVQGTVVVSGQEFVRVDQFLVTSELGFEGFWV